MTTLDPQVSFAAVRAAFTHPSGGALPQPAADALATALMGGANVVLAAKGSGGQSRVELAASRAASLFASDCGSSFVLTQAIAASRGGGVTGGPTRVVTKETLVDGVVETTTTETIEDLPLIPVDVGLVVLEDITRLDPDALAAVEGLLDDEPRHMNYRGRSVELPNLRTVVSIATGVALPAARRLGATFRFRIDVVIEVVAEDDPGYDHKGTIRPVLDLADLEAFDWARRSVETSVDVLEPQVRTLDALCGQADWAYPGLACRVGGVAHTRAAAYGRVEADAEDFAWALRERIHSFEVLSGKTFTP